MSGDGSAARPWSTLAEVVNPNNKLISTNGHGSGYVRGTDTAMHALNPDGPIKAGDMILLKSGNHGSPSLLNMFNTDFITVAAAPGATPIVGLTNIRSVSKWIFQGLTFEAMATTKTGATAIDETSAGQITIGRSDWLGASSDIIFDNNTIRAAASTTGWNDYDWYNKPYNVALWISSACVTATNNHVYNVLNGIVASGQKSLVQGNTIEYFSNDAMDITTSNLLIKNNIIRKGTNNPAEKSHADGIQGWSTITNGQPVPNTNVVIDGNILTKTAERANSYMQGISLFDGKWSGLVIQNNVVNVSHWNALAVYGGQNSRIVNNTVISADPVGHPSWIMIHDGKDGTKSTALLRNNIATTIIVQSDGTSLDHNVAAKNISLPSSNTTSGTVGNANVVQPAVLGGFAALDTTKGVFDMRIKPSSVAVGAGTMASAPALDIAGKSRTSPVDAGAYVHMGKSGTVSTGTSNTTSPAPQTASSSP